MLVVYGGHRRSGRAILLGVGEGWFGSGWKALQLKLRGGCMAVGRRRPRYGGGQRVHIFRVAVLLLRECYWMCDRCSSRMVS